MILSAQTIRKLNIISPFNERTRYNGVSYGISAAGYDVRVAETLSFSKFSRVGSKVFKKFKIASTMEHFYMPDNVLGRVADKSTWARKGVFVQNTIIEPGWRGFLTLEITSEDSSIEITSGTGIAQIIFEFLDEPTKQPYEGKYQDQQPGPQEAIFEWPLS